MKRILTIAAVFIICHLTAQPIGGLYRDYSGHELELRSDFTFTRTWSFDLTSNLTSRRWIMYNGTLILEVIPVHDTLILERSGDKGDLLVLSGDPIPGCGKIFTTATSAQNCERRVINMQSLDTTTFEGLDFGIFEQTDTAVLWLWYPKQYRSEVRSRNGESLRVKKAKPPQGVVLDSDTDRIHFRGHASNANLYIDGIRQVYYTLCKRW